MEFPEYIKINILQPFSSYVTVGHIVFVIIYNMYVMAESPLGLSTSRKSDLGDLGIALGSEI